LLKLQYITFLWNDANGRPLTIYGRYFRQHPPDGKPKTIASPGEKTKQSPLYFDRALEAGHKEIVLVEGVLDAVLLQAKGDTRVCAYVAANCSGDQIETLRRRRITRVTLCGDPDAGGENGTNSNLLRLVEAGISVYIAPKLPDGLDPDEFLLKHGMEGWKTHIDAAEHGFRWKARRLFESKDTSTDKGKADVLQGAIAFCKAVKNHPDLDVFFWSAVRNSLGMEPEEFRAQLERLWESSPVAVAELGGGSGNGGDDGGDGGDRTGKVVKHPSFSPISPSELEARLNALVQEGLTGSKLTNRLNQLAEETGRHIIELRKQYSERLAEVEQAELREDTAHQVEVLLEASTASLDLRKILPANLATPLLKLAGWLNLKPEAYLTTLLTTVSILHKAGTIVVLNKEWDFEVSPNMFATIISPSSQKKSPILKAICKKPLGILQREAHEEYKNQMKAYGEELKEWEATKPEDREEPPVKPERKIYFFTKTTGEGLTYQAARCPEQGILCLSDELAGMLGAQNQYRGGKGSDKQDWLTYYDGMGDTTLRAEGIKAESDFVLLGIIGGIQPKIMQKLLDDCSDSDGGWARFLFVNQPNAASQMSVDGGSYDLTDLLADLYRQIDALPATTYRLSPEAFRLFCKAYNRLEKKRVSDRLEGMQAVWGKSEGRIGKLAVNLHVIHALMKGQTPSEEIPVEFIQAAITLTKYYAQQVQSLYTQFSDPDALAPHLANVIQLAQRKGGWIKASDVYLSITKKHRPSGSTVREWFSELVLMGKGEVKGEGRSLQFRAFSDKHPPTPPPFGQSSEKLDDFRQELDKSSNAESTIYQDTQELLDKLDDLDNFSKHIMDVEALEARVDLTTEVEKTSLLDESSNLSNLVQDVQPETDTALDKSSNESSNLDALDTEEAIAPAQPLTDPDNVVAVADATPNPSPLPQKPSIEVADSTFADEPEVSEWTNPEELEAIARDLNQCEDAETLALLREAWQPQVMDAAYKLLSSEKHSLIKQWEIELNSTSTPASQDEPREIEAEGNKETYQVEIEANTSPSSTEPNQVPPTEQAPHSFKVGDRVHWDDCPGPMSGQNPFVIEEIEGATAKLEYFIPRAPLSELRIVN
jgi:hypothetical protein